MKITHFYFLLHIFRINPIYTDFLCLVTLDKILWGEFFSLTSLFKSKPLSAKVAPFEKGYDKFKTLVIHDVSTDLSSIYIIYWFLLVIDLPWNLVENIFLVNTTFVMWTVMCENGTIWKELQQYCNFFYRYLSADFSSIYNI